MPQLPELPWIWVPGGDAAHTQLALFRRTLELDEAPASAKIRISAETRYKLYVNGVLAALGPAKGDASEWFVDTVELAGLLRRGENVLAVEVLHYGTVEAQTNQSLFHTSTPGLYVEDVATGDALLGDALDGREQDAPAEIPANALAAIYAPRPACGLDVRADRRWRCRGDGGFSIVSENPFFGPLQILEDRAGDVTLAGWKLPGFDDSAWQKADPYDIVRLKTGVSPRNLRPRPIPAMRRERCRFAGLYGNRETSVPAAAWEALLAGRDRVVVPAHATEFVEIAAGEEMTGFLSLRVAGGAGATVRILTSECYVEAQEGGLMAETRKGDRTDASGELAGFTDTYRVAGSGSAEAPEAFEPFWFRTFRFVRLAVETADEPLALAGFDYEETGYPLEVRTWVETSDPAMADIWDMSLRTLERCMQETYTDCPFYEQLQYLHDARSQILFTYAVAADDRLARQAIDQFSRALRPDGTLNASYPCTEPNIIPGFSIYYILMLHDHMMWFGDRAFCMRYLPYVDAILGYFDRNLRADGLVGSLGGVNMGGRYWSFIDWSPAWQDTSGMPPAGTVGPLTCESLLYVLGLERAADLAAWVGRADTAREYRERAARVQEALRARCRDAEGFFVDGPGVGQYSQHAQILAILTGTVAPEEGARLLGAALDDPERFATCSIAFYLYLFRALEVTGLYGRTAGLWDLWRRMLDRHLTTCVENETSERSDCHAWGALALYELPCVVLGVRPVEPGCTAIEVAPHAGGLAHAEGEVATPRGMVKVAWTQAADGTFDLSCSGPKGVELRVKEA